MSLQSRAVRMLIDQYRGVLRRQARAAIASHADVVSESHAQLQTLEPRLLLSSDLSPVTMSQAQMISDWLLAPQISVDEVIYQASQSSQELSLSDGTIVPQAVSPVTANIGEVTIGASSSTSIGFVDVVFNVPPGENVSLAAYNVDVSVSGSGITILGVGDNTLSRPLPNSPLFPNQAPNVFSSPPNQVLASDDLPFGAPDALIEDGMGLVRIFYSVAPNTTGTFNLTFGNFTQFTNGAGVEVDLTLDNGSITVAAADPVITISDPSVNEGGSLLYQVTLSEDPTSPVEVLLYTSNGTAVTTSTSPLGGNDYVPRGGSIIFNPGDPLTQEFSVSTNTDSVREPNETVFLNVSAISGPAVVGDGQGTGTITNNDNNAGVIISDASIQEGDSGSQNLVFTISLITPHPTNVSGVFNTSGGTATAGSDYTAPTAANNQWSITAGQSSTTISVPIIGDLLVENNETFNVTLSGITGGVAGDLTAVGTITNNDVASFVVNDITQVETNAGTTTFAFTVSLTGPINAPTSVQVATGNGTATAGSDYVAAGPITLNFAANQTSQTFNVTVNGDTTVEPDETFFVNLSNASGAPIADSQGIGTITNDDAAAAVNISINDVTVTEGTGGTTQATFTVSLSAASGSTVQVTVNTANGTATTADGDYTAITNQLVQFAPGETSKQVTVTVNADAKDEDNETFNVNLSNASGGTITDSQGVGTINDDDAAPTLSVNDPSVTEGNVTADDRRLLFTISLSAASGKTVTVNYITNTGTALGTDFTTASGSLTFNPGETSKQIEILVTEDFAVEGNENFTFVLSSPVNATIADGSGTGTINNDDNRTISINDASVLEGNPGQDRRVVFTVTLSEAIGENVTFNYATNNGTAVGSDFTAISTTQGTILGGQTTTTIEVLVTEDFAVEVDENFAVVLSSPVNANLGDNSGTGTITNDDTRSISINDVSVVEGNPGGDSRLVFTVTLSQAINEAVTFNFATTGGTATSGNDFTAISTTQGTILANQTTTTIEVLVNEDFTIEPDENMLVTLSSPSANATLGDASGQGTITNDDNRTLSINDVSVSEGNPGDDRRLVFTVTLSQAINEAVTFNFATSGGTATSGTDFTPISTTQGTILAGQTTTTIEVLVVEDLDAEVNETMTVTLSSPTGNATLLDATGQGTINNDDVQPTISIAGPANIGEAAGPAAYTISLSNPIGTPVTVRVDTVDGTANAGSDFTGITNQTITFNPGETSKPLNVAITSDTIDEPNENFQVVLSNASGGAISGSAGSVTTSITDDDNAPAISINDVTQTEGNAGTTNFVFTVTLSNGSSSPVTVAFATADGTATVGEDYVANSGTLTFSPGQPLTQTVTVVVNGDTKFETNQTFFVNLTNPTNSTITDSQGVGTITNNDARPTVTIASASGNEGDTITFNVTLSNPSDETVSVQATVNDVVGGATVADNDYTDINGQTITFTSGVTAQTFVVQTTEDNKFEGDETFTVSLGSPVNAGSVSGAATGTILNDDAQPVLSIAGPGSITEGNAGTSNATYTVSLTNPSSSIITVLVNTANGTADGSDYNAVSQTLTFNPGETSKQVNVPIVGDTIDEPNETYSIALSSPSGATINGSAGSVTTTINDDDNAPAITINDVTQVETNSGTTAFVFTVTLSNGSASTVTVNFATGNGSATAGEDYVASSGTLTFSPGGGLTQTVTVLVNGDTKFETDQTFNVTLSGATNATISDATGLGTITNDDLRPTITITGATAAEGDAMTFNLSLSNASDETVTVLATVNDGVGPNGATVADNDYTDINGQTITFGPGVTAQTFVVQTTEDTKFEADQTLTVSLSGAGNAGGVSGSPATGIITNDDVRPTITITGAPASEGDAMTFNLTLSNASDETVTVLATVNDGVGPNGATVADNDYTDINGQTITFGPGVTAQTFVVQTTEDTKFETDQTLTVSLSGASNAGGVSGSPATGTITNDDVRPTITITGAPASEGDALSFNLTLSNPTDETVTVQATVNDGVGPTGATVADGDYTDINGQTITFNPGVTAQTFSVQTTEDTKFEPNETLTVSLANQTNATSVAGSPATGTINNDDPQPVISISGTSVVEGTGTGGVATYTVSLTNPSSTAVTVNVSTANGTAVAPGDFTAITNQVVTFNPGETSKQVNVQIAGDAVDENDETFSVSLSTPSGATINGSAASVTTTIIDDDGAPTLSINDVTQVETNSGTTAFVFTVTLSGSSASTVMVNFTTANGSANAGEDYVSNSGSLTFNPGTSTQTITVLVNGDTKFETDQTFNVTLSGATNATISDATGLGTITNDDARPTVTIASASAAEGDPLTFNVTLSNLSDETVSVQATVGDGTATTLDNDYTDINGQPITFAPGESSKQFVVQTTEDNKFENNETLTVSLGSPSNAGGVSGPATGTINNDDPQPSITINDVQVTEGNSGTVQATFTLTLSNPSGSPVTVLASTQDVAATAGSDYQALTNQLVTFAAGTTTQTVTVLVNGDTADEFNQTFNLVLSSPSGATIADGTGVGKILDDDSFALLSLAAVDPSIPEGGTFTFNVQLDRVVETGPVQVEILVEDLSALRGQDFTSSDRIVLVFAEGETSKQFTIATNQDSLFELDETFHVHFDFVEFTVGAGPGEDGTAPDVQFGENGEVFPIIENDDPAPTLTVSGGSVAEGNTAGDNKVVPFTIALSAAAGVDITGTVAITGGTATSGVDFTSINGQTFTILAGQTQVVVNVPIIEDTDVESNETITLTATPALTAVAAASGTGTIVNDDAVANIPPVAAAGPDQSVSPNTLVTLDGSGSFDPDGDPLTFLWTQTGGPAVILSSPNAVMPTFTPTVPGSYTFSLVVNDGEASSASDSVTINVVNTAPVANAGPDQNVSPNTLVTLDGSASSDADGNPLTFTWAQTGGPAVTLSNPSAVKPTFTPTVPGTYTFSLVVNDGQTNSAPDTVTINVLNAAPVANAGSDQGVSTGTPVTLNGSASSDPDGNPLTFNWTQTGGPAVTLSNPAAVMPTFTPTVPGTYTFNLVVNDGFVNSAPDSVTINVVLSNQAPTANAGGPYVVLEGGSVQVTGAGSSDPDQSTASLTFAWDLDNDGQFDDATGITANFSAAAIDGPSGGTVRTIGLRVTDSGGLSNTATTTVTINNANPTVAITEPVGGIVVSEGGSLSVAATGSDPAGASDPLTFAWDLDNDGQFDDAVGTSVNFSALNIDGPTTRTIRVQVSDGDGGTAIDDATVTINNANPTVAINEPGGGLTVTEGGTLGVSATASDPAGAADPLTFEWDLDNDGIFGETGPAAQRGNETGPTPTFSAALLDGPSQFTIGVRVTDGDGGSATDTALVTVTNAPPSLTNVAVTTSIDENGNVTLTGNIVEASPLDTLTLNINWGNGTETVNLPAGTTSFNRTRQYLDDNPTNTPGDAVNISLTVSDDDGGTSAPANVSTFVNNVAPVVAPITGPTNGTVGQQASYSSSFTDVGTQDTHTTAWQVRDAGNNVVATGSGLTFNFTPAAQGAFTVTFSVQDDDGGFASRTVTLNVAAAPVPTVNLVRVGSQNVFEGNAGFTDVFFEVTLSFNPTSPVQVQLLAVDGTATLADGDYQFNGPTSLTFNPNGALTQTVSVRVFGDTKFEANESLQVQLGTVTGANKGTSAADLTIVNDDDQVVPLMVSQVTVNGGLADRSNITQLAVQFSQNANIAALISSGQVVNAIKVVNTSTGTPVVLDVSRYQYDAASRTVRIDLTTDGFGGSDATMLANGQHQLQLDTALIAAASNGSNFLVDGDGVSDGIHRSNFHRLLGDFDGDTVVSTSDQNIFNAAYRSRVGMANYNRAADFDGDGDVDGADLLAFRRQLGAGLIGNT